MKSHSRVFASAVRKATRRPGLVRVSVIGRLLPVAFTMAILVSHITSGAASAQEVPELNLSTPAGRLTTGIPEVVLVPIRKGSVRNQTGGWVLIYRNFVRDAEATRLDVRSRRVGLPGLSHEGVITWEITHTLNAKCIDVEGGCPDQIRVLSVPEGYMAVPESAQVEEREGLRILIIPIVIG